MTIEKKPFVRYDEKTKNDVISLKINKEEREIINNAKKILEQTKDGTTIKTLALIGYKSITTPKIEYLINQIFRNKRNNERLGINDFN